MSSACKFWNNVTQVSIQFMDNVVPILPSFFLLHTSRMHTKCSTVASEKEREREMQSLLRLINTRRISTGRNGASLLASSYTARSSIPPNSLPQSESQLDHSMPDPNPPSTPELVTNSVAWRLEKLPREQSVVVAFQSWMRDGFAVHRGHIFHTINRLRRRHLYSRALEVNLRFT